MQTPRDRLVRRSEIHGSTGVFPSGGGGVEKRIESAHYVQRAAGLCGSGGAALWRTGLPRDQRQLPRAPTTNSFCAVNIDTFFFFVANLFYDILFLPRLLKKCFFPLNVSLKKASCYKMAQYYHPAMEVYRLRHLTFGGIAYGLLMLWVTLL